MQRQKTLAHVLVTVSTHCAITAVHLVALAQAGGGGAYGVYAVQIASLHLMSTIGLFGPPNCRFWWVPSPVHDKHALLLLFAIGATHLLGVGVIEYGKLEPWTPLL